MDYQPSILQRTSTSIILALSDTEIGKVVLPNPVKLIDVSTGLPLDLDEPTLKKEVKLLRYANAINDLLPQFIRQQKWIDVSGKEYEMMVMERLPILPTRHFDQSIRKEMIAIFEQKIKQLHDNLFVHGDFMRPTRYYNRNDMEWIFGNIVQTETGLRLIDTGFSQIYSRSNSREFCHILVRERDEVEAFKEYYLENV